MLCRYFVVAIGIDEGVDMTPAPIGWQAIIAVGHRLCTGNYGRVEEVIVAIAVGIPKRAFADTGVFVVTVGVVSGRGGRPATIGRQAIIAVCCRDIAFQHWCVGEIGVVIAVCIPGLVGVEDRLFIVTVGIGSRCAVVPASIGRLPVVTVCVRFFTLADQ